MPNGDVNCSVHAAFYVPQSADGEVRVLSYRRRIVTDQVLLSQDFALVEFHAVGDASRWSMTRPSGALAIAIALSAAP